MKELEIEIAPDGTVSIQVKGVAGPDCLKETKEIEEALGNVVSREKTGEFYEEKTETQSELDQFGG